MEKPQSKTRTIYNLFEVLRYANEEVEDFKDKIWEFLCDESYIKNDTCVYIPFENFLEEEEYYGEDVIKGVKFLIKEMPEILDEDILFEVSW